MIEAEYSRMGRTTGADSQVVRHPPGRLLAGSGYLRDPAPGTDGPSRSATSGGLHHATGNSGSSQRNSPSQVHWKWRVYAFFFSCVGAACGAGATLMEAFNK